MYFYNLADTTVQAEPDSEGSAQLHLVERSELRKKHYWRFSVQKILWMLGIMMLVGCASTPVEEIKPFDKNITVEAAYDDVWSNLIRFMSTNDISIASVEKDSGLIVLTGDNLSASLISEYCDATPPFLWTLTGGKASGSVIVNDDEGFVTVTVNAKFQGTSYTSLTNPPQYSTKPCNSRGAFEAAVLGSIKS